MTDQLEPIDESTRYRRKIDETLARFSAAHDELAAEERQREERRRRLAARPVQLLEQTRTKLQRVVLPLVGDKEPEGAAEEGEAPADEPDPTAKAPRTRLQEKKQRRSERSVLVARIAAAVLAGLVFLATGVAWGAMTWFDGKFNQIAALDENSADIRNAAGQTGDENFLIVGSDIREGAAAEEGVGDADGVPGARADTVMIAHIPANRKRAVVVSFPRDLEVDRPECQRWDSATGDYGETAPAAGRVKLNSVYSVGGPRCLTKLVQQMSGMRMNHFVGLDFHGFKGMVDAVHGVQVHVEQPIDDEVLGMVVAETGPVTLRGDQALNYVRARHVKGDPTSDYGRIKRQQEFLKALLTKTMSRDVLFDPGKLTGFINAFAASTFGENIGVQQMLTLAQSMRGMDPGTVRFETIPTVGEANKRGNEVLRKEKAAELFRALIENSPLPSDRPPVPASAAPVR
ncbi:cell envelope-related function transcriptional attenuator common domain-containing protein [Amycolatopsis arida]|uniref:Cell envelope-related function transcriptional attenuator common domain-containing protein n=2 Tax=Amycolatopsis arida TaxID=587909 RepID=A0A1I5STW4_9PSEU|nr:LCP family protein [Amycolatopsis arida]TDX96348.1 LCP family protein required for cell wall assembly [Amycolatopsis arida]SFP74244.1 cell envelope-related function transcriptional attenuator common domain-containing protein [Amycolatopsis arida]